MCVRLPGSTLDPEKISLSDVVSTLGVPREKIIYWSGVGMFPAPIEVSRVDLVFIRADVEAWRQANPDKCKAVAQGVSPAFLLAVRKRNAAAHDRNALAARNARRKTKRGDDA